MITMSLGPALVLGLLLAPLGGEPSAGESILPFDGVESARFAVFVGGPGTPDGRGGMHLFGGDAGRVRSFEDAALEAASRRLRTVGIALHRYSMEEIGQIGASGTVLTVSVWGRPVDKEGLRGWYVYSLDLDIASLVSDDSVEGEYTIGTFGVSQDHELETTLTRTLVALLSRALGGPVLEEQPPPSPPVE